MSTPTRGTKVVRGTVRLRKWPEARPDVPTRGTQVTTTPSRSGYWFQELPMISSEQCGFSKTMSKQTPTSLQNMNEPEIIYKAVQDGSIEVLSQLFYLDPNVINHRCEINSKTLVETAVELGQEEVLLFLLQFHDLCVSEEANVIHRQQRLQPLCREKNERKDIVMYIIIQKYLHSISPQYLHRSVNIRYDEMTNLL